MPQVITFSAAQAAQACGVSRATIQRAIAAGRFPHASRNENGWSITVADLLAAGFNPGKPAPAHTEHPTPVHPDREHERGHAQVPDADMLARLHTLELELATTHARADLEHAHRLAAEQLAAERLERLHDLHTQLRMLMPAPVEASTAAPAPVAQSRPGGLVGRLRSLLVG